MKEKKIEDYLPFYFGSEVEYGYEGTKKIGTLVGNHAVFGWQIFTGSPFVQYHNVKPELITLLLRPLSSMTEDEAKELIGIKDTEIVSVKKGGIQYRTEESGPEPEYLFFSSIDPTSFKYLLSKGFDLFGLIESKLALDKTLVKN